MNPISMTLQELATSAAALGAVLAAFVALARLFIAQSERRLDERFETMELSRRHSQDEWREQFEHIEIAGRENEKRTLHLLSELPLQYQRREDAIRQEVAIIARLDALSTKLSRALECDTRHCPVKEVLHDR